MMLRHPGVSGVAGLLMFMALCITPAHADVANGLRYSVPTGWSPADKDGVRIVSPSRLGAGELMVAVLLGVQSPTGTPEDQIAAIAAVINADVKVTSSSNVLLTDLGSAGKVHIKTFDVQSTDIGAHGRMIAVLVRGDQRAAVLFLMTDNKVMQKYGDGIQALLKSLAIDPNVVIPAPAAKQPASGKATDKVKPSDAGHLPTGETPDLYPGSTGWLPSGRGVAIPAARVVKGRPEGMWWQFQSRGSRAVAMITIFLADGTRATNPRPGSGTLFDLDGQKSAKGTTGVGTFSIKDGKITQAHDGFTTTDAFKFGSGADGAWIEIGAARLYPLAPATAKDLVGNWKSQGQMFKFRADGTLEGGGTWQLDGYLLAITNNNSARYITTVGRSGKLLVIGSSSYSRE